ncbi:MAG TPA: Lrp/AsnC family transcriptional regulator [Candidatus Nanopelagicales bacterium]|jgi:Lrp/AsnC family leucine-responsive transcriptional regulator
MAAAATPSGPRGLDAVDVVLLEALRANGRASYVELARSVGLSAPSVQDRVRRLEERGYVSGYAAVVPPQALGLGVSALVGIGQSESADQEDVARRLRDLPEIEDCYLVAGEDAFIAKVRVADVAALERTLARLQAIRGVSRTRTTVVLSTRWEGRAQPVVGDPTIAGQAPPAPAGAAVPTTGRWPVRRTVDR